MPKKKANTNKEPEIVYDIELIYGECETHTLKMRKLVPYTDFCQASYGVVETLFANGYSPAEYSYVYNATLIKLFTNCELNEPDDILREVYVNHLDEKIYDNSAQAVAFRDAVTSDIDYRKNRSPFDTFFDSLNTVDFEKLNKVIEKLSTMQFTKEDITKIVTKVTKGVKA